MFSYAGQTKTLFLLTCDALKKTHAFRDVTSVVYVCGEPVNTRIRLRRNASFTTPNFMRVACPSTGAMTAPFSPDRKRPPSRITVQLIVRSMISHQRDANLKLLQTCLKTAGPPITFMLAATRSSRLPFHHTLQYIRRPPPVAPIRENAAYGANTSMFASSHAGWYAGRYEQRLSGTHAGTLISRRAFR